MAKPTDGQRSQNAAPRSAGTSSGFQRVGEVLETSDDKAIAERVQRIAAQQQQARERRQEAVQRIGNYWQTIARGDEPSREQPPERVAEDGLPWCELCFGRRWLRASTTPDADDFGRPVRCPRCLESPAIAPSLHAQAARAAGLLEDQVSKTFANFRANALNIDAARAAKAWAQDPVGWLVLHGEPGSGKTHLACAAVNWLLAAGRAVRLWYAPDLIDAIKAAYDGENDAVGWLLRSLKEQPILVLDDLWAVRPTENTIEVLEKLFDYRYRDRRPTLVTMIGSPEDVKARRSESIGRRMQDTRISQVVHNRAPQWGQP